MGIVYGIGGWVFTQSEYGHSPYNFPEDFTFHYRGGFLEIAYVFYGGRVDSEVGLLIFIDGIVQPYFVGDYIEESDFEYMHIFNVIADSEQVVSLNILPTVGEVGDYLQLNFVCIGFPLIQDISMLDLQSMSTTFSWTLLFLEDRAIAPISLSKTEISSVGIFDIVGAEFNESGSSFHKEINQNDRKIRFIASSNEGLYRVTLFANNSPIVIDGNKNHFNIYINNNEKITYEFEINVQNDQKTLYAIIVRLSGYVYDYQLDVFKTNSEALTAI